MSDKPPFENPPRAQAVGSAAIILTLSPDDFDMLLLALGMAAGTCLRDGRKGLALKVIELSNKVNENNPRWIPYETPSTRTSDQNSASQPNSNTK